MSTSFLIYNALCLPAPDVEALIQGRIIAAMPRKWINNPGQAFALYPANISNYSLPLKHHYRSNFLPIIQHLLGNFQNEKVLIKAWAKCEVKRMPNDSKSLESLSKLSIWTKESLEQILKQRPYTSLAYLRVYLLPEPIEIAAYNQPRHFIPLPQQLKVSDTNPVLTDNIFATRKRQLEKLEPPAHPELEDLLGVLSPLSLNNVAAKQLEQKIQTFLGWNNQQANQTTNPNLDWVNEIAALGNRTKEEDKKTNYHAGTDFENIVRQSLEFLGFTVDYFHKGGAGGVDVFCSHPYPLVGECKSGKKIPNDTAVQLLNLGTLRLQSQELLKQATKLIIGPGKPTTQLKDAAKVHGMAVINPETLEKLVNLQSKYPNSIDLFKLQNFLKAGQCDAEVEKYILQVETEIKLRSHLIQIVKKHKENTGDKNIEVATLYGAYGYSNPPLSLTRQEMYETLIELSSPLTGYLGRIKGSDWKSDKFYFLRDLAI
ncbi:MAG: DUF1802 family protein [Rivularia sp. (in: cyanobacteria)]